MLDLQIHTTDSDGTWTWNQVLDECLKMGLTAFAITDHDTIIRREAVLEWARQKKAMAIPGVELSTQEDGETVHLLGYFLDGPLSALEAELRAALDARNFRNEKIVGKLQKMGYEISMEELKRIATGEPVGRPHIAQLLMAKGYVKTIREAFQRFLHRDGAAFHPKDDMALTKGIQLLHEAGAVAVVAHPCLLKKNPQDLEVAAKIWRDAGLDGIEVYYPSHNLEQVGYLERLAGKLGLLMTGGSDFHGENKPHIRIGVGYGELKVPDALLEPLLKRRQELKG